jgi:hypothetical protein
MPMKNNEVNGYTAKADRNSIKNGAICLQHIAPFKRIFDSN